VRPIEAHRTHGRGALRHGQRQGDLRRQWHSPATRLGRQGWTAWRRRGEKAVNAAIGTRTRQRPRTARWLRTERGFGQGWRGGRVRRDAWSASDSAAARLTERSRRRLRADTVKTAGRRLRRQTVWRGHERRCGRDGDAQGEAGRAADGGRNAAGRERFLIPHVCIQTAPPMATN
jgi:hypothetical protein